MEDEKIVETEEVVEETKELDAAEDAVVNDPEGSALEEEISGYGIAEATPEGSDIPVDVNLPDELLEEAQALDDENAAIDKLDNEPGTPDEAKMLMGTATVSAPNADGDIDVEMIPDMTPEAVLNQEFETQTDDIADFLGDAMDDPEDGVEEEEEVE